MLVFAVAALVMGIRGLQREPIGRWALPAPPGAPGLLPTVFTLVNGASVRVGPYTVDRVVSDGKRTYVALHGTVPWRPRYQPAWMMLDLVDNRGIRYDDWSGLCWVEPNLFGLLDWLPWHTPVQQRCLSQSAALLPGTRSVHLTIFDPGPLRLGAMPRAGAAAIPIGRP